MPYIVGKNQLIYPDIEEIVTAPQRYKRGQLLNALGEERVKTAPVERNLMKVQTEREQQQMGVHDLAQQRLRWITGLGMLANVTDANSYAATMKQIEAMQKDTFMREWGDMPNVTYLEGLAQSGQISWKEFADEMRNFRDVLSGQPSEKPAEHKYPYTKEEWMEAEDYKAKKKGEKGKKATENLSKDELEMFDKLEKIIGSRIYDKDGYLMAVSKFTKDSIDNAARTAGYEVTWEADDDEWLPTGISRKAKENATEALEEYYGAGQGKTLRYDPKKDAFY